jgi:hypothetical protein
MDDFILFRKIAIKGNCQEKIIIYGLNIRIFATNCISGPSCNLSLGISRSVIQEFGCRFEMLLARFGMMSDEGKMH